MTLAMAGPKAKAKTKHFYSTCVNYDHQNIFIVQAKILVLASWALIVKIGPILFVVFTAKGPRQVQPLLQSLALSRTTLCRCQCSLREKIWSGKTV